MKFYSIIFLLVLPSLVLSQGSSQGAASMKLPITSSVGSTGESFIADSAAIQSVLINPADIAAIKSYNVLFSHTEWIQDIHTEFLSIAVPLRLGNATFSIGNTSVDDIQIHGDEPGPSLGTFNSQSAFFQITYGLELTNRIHIGLASKYLYEKIFVDETTGFGFDAGALYLSPISGLNFGFSLTNLGNLSAFRSERIDLPTTIHLGGTYSFPTGKLIFRAAAAFADELGFYQHLNFGSEVIYNNLIALRLGYQTGYTSRNLAGGLGVRYSIATIDYAYIPFYKQLGNAHIISVGFSL